ncbi:hypothetical protein CWB74_07745 [Pseudoalteromonas piscicida]|uniref:Uncharacterized protein n=1 Tax=Pseudoalteromonas piscicida TaxID=43662 RepID=A0AAQ2ISM7_PSEO7|nr:hypothetical protein CWB95_22495 [Pseudoalteromonas piscicida]TMN78490.1 hypothetical protein CWB74_07745 [Pseudoalteromonas piscicida]
MHGFYTKKRGLVNICSSDQKDRKKGCTKIGSPYNATPLTRGATLKSKAATSWRQVKLKFETSAKEIQN